jgi:branched-chain amino acid transport system ATP-binding protein
MSLMVTQVCKAFGRLQAVEDVSLTVAEGQIVGLIGPNGSGKSTLLNLIAGAQRADRGRIEFAGREITQLSTDEIYRLGLVRSYQDPALFFRMSALDNLLLPVKDQRGEAPLWAPLHHTWAGEEALHAKTAAEVLEQLRIRPHYDKLAADLSGGQMKLLELGRSLMGAPRLLLLDEPTAGVAPALAYTIFEQIEQLRAGLGLSFLIVEHRLEMLFDFVDQLYVMHLGRVIAEGAPAVISANPQVREIYFGE